MNKDLCDKVTKAFTKYNDGWKVWFSLAIGTDLKETVMKSVLEKNSKTLSNIPKTKRQMLKLSMEDVDNVLANISNLYKEELVVLDMEDFMHQCYGNFTVSCVWNEI